MVVLSSTYYHTFYSSIYSPFFSFFFPLVNHGQLDYKGQKRLLMLSIFFSKMEASQ